MIRNLILVVLAVTASAMLSSSVLSQTGEASLRWQFPVGRKLEIEMTQRMNNTQNLAGKEMSTAMSTTHFMTWEVESFDESSGVATFKSAIDRVKLNMDSSMGKFEIDSDSDKKPEGLAKVVGEKLDAMVGKPFGQTINAWGEVLTVDFQEEFSQAERVSTKKLIKDTLWMFPSEPIAVGHSWTQETTTPMPGGAGVMLLASTYTYRGRETVEDQELEVIDINRTMTFKEPEDSQASIDIIGQSTEGKMYFDAANGHAKSMKVDQSVTMDITHGGQKINQTIENMTECKFQLAK